MKEHVSELALLIDTLDMDITSLVDGLLYRNYEFKKYKSKPDTKIVKNINLITSRLQPKELNSLCYVYTAIYDAIYMARDLTNMPSNELTPRKFAEKVQEICQGDTVTVESLNKWNLENEIWGHRCRWERQCQPAPARERVISWRCEEQQSTRYRR